MKQPISFALRVIGALALVFTFSFGATTALADNDNEPTAFLYEGSCIDLDNAKMVDDIDELDEDDMDDLEEYWQDLGNGEVMPSTLLAEDGEVREITSIQMLLDTEYAVVVHETDSKSSIILACGDITGEIDDQGHLLFQLDEVNDSGWEGRVFIHTWKRYVKFVVGIYPTGAVSHLIDATPVATP